MQTLTATQLAWLRRGGEVKKLITITPELGNPISLDWHHDIVENSFSLDRSSALTNDIEIGCAQAAECSLDLYRSEKFEGVAFEGARLELAYDIAGATIPGGVFTIDKKPASGMIMRISALDNMIKFSRPFDSDITYPATLGALLSDACVKCGVTNSVGAFLNSGLVVTRPFDALQVTYHQLISWIACMAGKNAYCDEAGNLRFRWYDGSTLELGIHDYFEVEVAERDRQVTGLVALNRQGIEIAVGTDDYVLDLSGNPLLEDNTEALLTGILQEVGSVVWRPLSYLDAIALPHVWPGDQLAVTVDDTPIATIVTSHRLTSTSSITAAGETLTAKGYAALPRFTNAEQRQIIEVVHAKKIRAESVVLYDNKDLDEKITDIEAGKITLSTSTVIGPEAKEQLKGDPGVPGDQGTPGESAYEVQIISTNGNLFKNGVIETWLQAVVYYGGSNITDTIDANRFRWTRQSSDSSGDAAWNSVHFSGQKAVQVTTDDVAKRATFFCDILKED